MLMYGSPFLNLADDHTHTDSGPCMSSGGLVQLALIHHAYVWILSGAVKLKVHGVAFLDEHIAWIQPPL